MHPPPSILELHPQPLTHPDSSKYFCLVSTTIVDAILLYMILIVQLTVRKHFLDVT